MAKFTDSKGDAWDITLDVGTLERLAAEADFDLDAAMEKPESLGAAFTRSPRALGQLLWVLCDEQAKARGLDPRAFGRRLDRPTLDAAADAFFEAAVLFYPRSSAGRAIRGRIPEMLARMDAEIERKTTELLEAEFSATATASPASAGATTPAG